MYCQRCGNDMIDGNAFCSKCGQSQEKEIVFTTLETSNSSDIVESLPNDTQFVDVPFRVSTQAKNCCKSCGSSNVNFFPKTDITVKSSGCMSVLFLILILSSMSFVGLLLVGSIISMAYEMRYFLMAVGIVVLYVSMLGRIRGKPCGTAACQSCGKQWDIDKKGNPFKPRLLLKALVLLLVFFVVGYVLRMM